MWPFSILTPCCFEAEAFDIAGDADGEDDAVDGDLAGQARFGQPGRDAVFVAHEALHAGPGMDGHALLGEGFARKGGDLGILDRKDAVEHLDHGHFGAERAVEACELDADGAGADHQQRFGKGRRHHGVLVGPHQPAVGLEPRQLPRSGAGRYHDMFGGDGARRAVLAGDRYSPLTLQRGLSVDHRDLVLLHQVGDAV